MADYEPDCLFCRIAAGEIPAEVVYSDDAVVAFRDINPRAPTHVLVIPRRHIPSAADLTDADGPTLAALFGALRHVAEEVGPARLPDRDQRRRRGRAERLPPAPAPARRTRHDLAAGMTVTEGFAEAIAAGYGFEGPGVELGAAQREGTTYPAARVRIPLAMLNRHGLVAGATGTGKTKSLQVMAEQLSAAGVPVFISDIKGDISGLGAAGTPDERVTARLSALGLTDFAPRAFPVEFFTLVRDKPGVRLRARSSRSARSCWPRSWSSTRPRRASWPWPSSTPRTAGMPLVDLGGPARAAQPPRTATSARRRWRPTAAWRPPPSAS